jgi:hypothetical protein
MDYTTEQARQFLHQLLRHRYNTLIRTIKEKFPVTEAQKERLESLITYEFIQEALGQEDP